MAASAAAARQNDRAVTFARYGSVSISCLLAALLAPRDALRQAPELAFIHSVVVAHSDQKLLGEAAAKTVDDLPYRAGGHAMRRVHSDIDVRAAFHRMLHVAFLFQALEDGAHGRFLHRRSEE